MLGANQLSNNAAGACTRAQQSSKMVPLADLSAGYAACPPPQAVSRPFRSSSPAWDQQHSRDGSCNAMDAY